MIHQSTFSLCVFIGFHCFQSSLCTQRCRQNSDCAYCGSRVTCSPGYGYICFLLIDQWSMSNCPDKCSANPGSYCNIMTLTPCPAGSYCSTSGYNLPSTCQPGQFCPTTGLTSYTQCTPGHFCPFSNMTTPIPCPKNNFCPVSGLSTTIPCQQCPKLHFANVTCTPIADAQCTPCDKCSDGTYSVSDCNITNHSMDCQICPLGFYCVNSSKFKCPDSSGLYCDPGSSVALPCPVGFECPNSYTKLFCANNYLCLAGTSSKILCPKAYTCPNATVVLPCPAGFSCMQGTSSPVPCLPGFSCPIKSIYPTRCSAGYMCPDGSNQIRCANNMMCPSGTTNPTMCPSGMVYRPEQNPAQCVFPLAGEYILELLDNTSQIVIAPCPNGSYFCAGGMAPYQNCSSCHKGTYVSSPCTPYHDTICSQCDTGYFCTNGSVKQPCTVCNWPFETDDIPCNLTADTICKQIPLLCYVCPRGYFCSDEMTPPTKCSTTPIGYYAQHNCNETSDNVFAICNPGYFCLGGNTTSAQKCSQCTAGQYQSLACTLTSDTMCISCPLGWTCSADTLTKSRCTNCKLGEHIAMPCTATLDTVCKPCNGNSIFCPDGRTKFNCSTCKEGQYVAIQCNNITDTVCLQCPPNKLCKTGINVTECSKCPQGTHGLCNATTDTVCIPCEPGFYCVGGTQRQIPCNQCAAGHYLTALCTPEFDAECLPCPPDYFCINGNVTECSACGANEVIVSDCSAASNTQCSTCQQVCGNGTFFNGSCTCATCPTTLV